MGRAGAGVRPSHTPPSLRGRRPQESVGAATAHARAPFPVAWGLKAARERGDGTAVADGAARGGRPRVAWRAPGARAAAGQEQRGRGRPDCRRPPSASAG